MKISFNMTNGTSLTSPSFKDPSPSVMESFWDEYLGGDIEDNELFWCADVQGSDDWIHVDWFHDPVNPDRVIKEISGALQVPIPPLREWRPANVCSWNLSEMQNS